jgi:hypothetical protein
VPRIARMRCARWASWVGVVRAAKMAQDCRTDRKPAFGFPGPQHRAVGANDSTPNGKEALKLKTPAWFLILPYLKCQEAPCKDSLWGRYPISALADTRRSAIECADSSRRGCDFRGHAVSIFQPRRRNLWVTDMLQWRPRARARAARKPDAG